MNFDDIIVDLGEFGAYQKRMYFLVCLVAIPACHLALATVFTLALPEHRCAIPGLENDTYVSQGHWHDDMIDKVIPWDYDTKTYSECTVFAQDDHGFTNTTEECSRYVYSKDPFSTTLISDLDLVCDKLAYRTYANMILMAGLLVGSSVMGPLADVFGRKPVLLLDIAGYVAASIAIAFAPDYITFVILRFLTAFAGNGMFLCSFVMGMELVGPSKRKYAGIVIELFWCIGMYLLCGMAYGIRDWRLLKIATTAPITLMLFYYWLMPESPRWLISKGRMEQARVVLRKAAEVNGVVLSESTLNLNLTQEAKGEKIWHMFTTPILLIRCLIIFFIFLVSSMVYYGLNLNVGALSGNIYLNFTFTTSAELASYLFCLFLLDVWGRKALQCFSMLLGGVACIATMFPVIFLGPEWITITLSMVGKFGASASFATIYVFAAELFPTCMRNSGMAASSLSARIGGILAPYIADLGTVVKGDLGVALPLIVFGGLCVAGGVTSLWLPETLNRELPDTVEDANNFGKSPKKQKAFALQRL